MYVYLYWEPTNSCDSLLQCALYCSGLKLSWQHHLAMPVQPFKLQDLGILPAWWFCDIKVI